MDSIIPLLTWALLILLGALFLAGLISLRRIAARDQDLSLSGPVRTMTIAGLSIMFICSLVVIYLVVCNLSTMAITREFEKVECSETPITDMYKMVVTKRRDGKVEASIDGIDGERELIWVREYAAAGKYLLGNTDGDYFWLDQETRGRRIFREKADYVDSLKGLGITALPEFLPAETICQTLQCQPCPIK